jgi:Skp family chaperone for outer membrane proteins
MGAIAMSPRSWTRRKAIALAVLPLGVGLDSGLCLAADQAIILVVSRKRLLNDTNSARALLKAEIELTTKLQHRVDAIKAELNDEEQELTRLRPTLDREVFDARVAEFDRKIRTQRREAQQQAAVLQNLFRAERLRLVEALGPLLEEVRMANGASIILNSDQALASDPTLDITDEVLARFNATMEPPTIPDLESISTGVDPAPDPAPKGEPTPQ